MRSFRPLRGRRTETRTNSDSIVAIGAGFFMPNSISRKNPSGRIRASVKEK